MPRTPLPPSPREGEATVAGRSLDPPTARARATAGPRPTADPVRLALARSELEAGEGLRGLAALLGTPLAPRPETPAPEATATGSASPRAPSPTPHGLPVTGAALARALAGQSAEGLDLYARALEAAGYPGGAGQAHEALAEALPALADESWMAASEAYVAGGDNLPALEAATRSRDLTGDAGLRALAELRRGNALLRLGRLDEALGAYQAAEGLATTDLARAQAMAGAIAAELEAGRDGRAQALRRRLLREMPGSELAPTALSRLRASGAAVAPIDEARVLAAQGDPAAALALLGDAAGEHAPEAVAWRLDADDPESALAAADAALAAGLGDDEPALLWARARALDALERPGEAEAALADLATRWPDAEPAGDALWRLAQLQEAAGAPLAAASSLSALAEGHPEHARARDAAFRAGLLHWLAGHAAEAGDRWSAAMDEPVFAVSLPRLAYWAGRASEDLGDGGTARDLWLAAEEADPTGLYGLLGRARRLGVHAVGGDPLAGLGEGSGDALRSAPIQHAAASPAVDHALARAAAQRRLGRAGDAGASLAEALAAEEDPAALLALAEAAAGLGLWTPSLRSAEAALRAAAAGRLEDVPARVLALAYPANLHGAAVEAAAREADLEPAALFGLVRQESRFQPDARSHVGATGLTQLMPDTASLVAGWLGHGPPTEAELEDPELSLRYGAAFLAYLLERYDGRLWPALAAYNAGPGPVDRWWAAAGGDDALFLELVAYPETSAYLRGVAAATAMYRWRYPQLR